MPKTKAIFFFLFIGIVTIDKWMQKDYHAMIRLVRYDGRYYDLLKDASNYTDKRRKVNTKETT